MKNVFLFVVVIFFLGAGSNLSAQTQVLTNENANKLSAEAKKSIEFVEKATSSLMKNDVKPEDFMKKLDQAVWEVNEQTTFREYYIDGSCGDTESKDIEYVTGSISVSKKPESLNNPFKFQLMFPIDVVRDHGAYVSFCKASVENASIVQRCDTGATFVLSYSACDERKQACIVGLENFYVNKSGIKLNLYSFIKANNYIEVAYHGAHGFRRCAIPYTSIKNILK